VDINAEIARLGWYDVHLHSQCCQDALCVDQAGITQVVEAAILQEQLQHRHSQVAAAVSCQYQAGPSSACRLVA